MTDLEISKALALAIGWKLTKTMHYVFPLTMEPRFSVYDMGVFRTFDYRDWAVAGPIAERFDCFPGGHEDRWCSQVEADGFEPHYADTPQKAIALAVINRSKKC